MAPSHSTISSEAAHIPLRRFTSHLFLSTLAIAIPQLLQYFGDAYLKDGIAHLNWSATHMCGFMIYMLGTRPPHEHAFLPGTIYGIIGSTLIATLHIITTLLGRRVGDPDSGFTTRQHIAVHFCLVFYVITELEFYRAYIVFKRFDTYADCLRYLPRANVDHSFPYRRDPVFYMIDLPNSWRRYLDGDNDPSTFWAIAFSKSHNALFASYLLFHVVWKLANYPIKRIVNPDPEFDLCGAIVDGLILFGTYPAPVWEVLLGLVLLRVVRQANYVGFWAVVGLVSWWRERHRTIGIEGEDENEGGYEMCAECGKHS